jgi:hypothetical protein
MVIYRVSTFAPLFNDCGTNLSSQRCFSSQAAARRFAVSEKEACSEYDAYKILITSLELKDINKGSLLEAFNTEDIVDLVEKSETILEYRLDLESVH